jgi:cytochrome c oxidase subunit 4
MSHSAHAQSHADAHADAHDVAKHVRGYLIIGAALLIGTVLTVWASYIDMHERWGIHPHWNIVLALVIATIKASLVALFFMHLISEKQMIYTVLAFTVVFFAGLMILTLWSLRPTSIIHIPGVT